MWECLFSQIRSTRAHCIDHACCSCFREISAYVGREQKVPLEKYLQDKVSDEYWHNIEGKKKPQIKRG